MRDIERESEKKGAHWHTHIKIDTHTYILHTLMQLRERQE